jgi:hypothetical protein
MYKVYKLVFNNEVVYVGITKLSLSRRKNAGYKKSVPFYKECKIELVEQTDDETRERYWIEYYTSNGNQLLNRNKGIGLNQEEYRKKYYDLNRDKLTSYANEKYYQIKDEPDFKEYVKEYKEKNKEKLLSYIKEYNEVNKERLKEYRREYYKEYHRKKREKLSLES